MFERHGSVLWLEQAEERVRDCAQQEPIGLQLAAGDQAEASKGADQRTNLLLQNLIRCPITTDPVDGSWGEWSDWDQCSFDNPDTRVSSRGDYCQCRRRGCDSPAPG